MAITLGIDVSTYQDPSGTGDRRLIDWAAVGRSAYRFALARMTIGRGTRDEDGRQNLRGMRGKVGVPGAYGVVGYEEPVEDGAKLLVDEIAAAGADPHRMLVMLDAEDFGDGRHPTIAQVSRYAEQLHREIGRWPVAYVPGWWLSNHGYRVAGRPLANCPWAASRYFPAPWTEPRLVANRPTDLRGFKSLAWLQYAQSGTVPGIASQVDLNCFYGTLDQLRQRLLGQTPPSQEGDLTPQEHAALLDIQRRVSNTDEIQTAIGRLTAKVEDVQRRVSTNDETFFGVAALVRLTIVDMRSRGIEIPPEALQGVPSDWIPTT
jgi:hypothetical protein